MCGRPRWAGGPFRARRMSGATRQTDGVTPQSPRAWLGATGSRDPPAWRPPTTATPIRFLPIKQPVFLLGKPCQQWSLGKRHGGVASGGRVSLQAWPIKLTRRAPGRGRLGLGRGLAGPGTHLKGAAKLRNQKLPCKIFLNAKKAPGIRRTNLWQSGDLLTSV